MEIFKQIGQRYLPRQGLWLKSTYVMLACCLLVILAVAFVEAQEGEQWTTPISLSQMVVDDSGSIEVSAPPLLVADEWGDVHAFWPAYINGQAGGGDAIFYTRWDGTAWSLPGDIIYLPNRSMSLPQLALDTRGWFHIIWVADDKVWHSHAPVAEAGSAKAWSIPLQVNSEPIADSIPSAGGLTTSIAVDTEENVHILYCAQDNTKLTVQHVSSADGETWSTPTPVSSGLDVCVVKMAIDERNRLHLVFRFEADEQAVVYYTRSDDGGLTWLNPVEVDRKDDRYWEQYAPSYPTVMPVGDEQIHLVWFGAPANQRWHQWSADGGNTWSPPQQILNGIRLRTWAPAMAVDSLGSLHLVSIGDKVLYHAYWRDGRWSFPVPIARSEEERAALAITRGNTLHVIWDDRIDGKLSIWAARLKTDAPAMPSKSRPSTLPKPNATTTAPIMPTVTPTSIRPIPTAMVNATDIQRQPFSENRQPWLLPFLAGGLPVILLAALALVTKRRHRW